MTSSDPTVRCNFINHKLSSSNLIFKDNSLLGRNPGGWIFCNSEREAQQQEEQQEVWFGEQHTSRKAAQLVGRLSLRGKLDLRNTFENTYNATYVLTLWRKLDLKYHYGQLDMQCNTLVREKSCALGRSPYTALHCEDDIRKARFEKHYWKLPFAICFDHMWYVGLVLSHALQPLRMGLLYTILHYCEDGRGKATSPGKTLFIYTHCVGEVSFEAHEKVWIHYRLRCPILVLLCLEGFNSSLFPYWVDWEVFICPLQI